MSHIRKLMTIQNAVAAVWWLFNLLVLVAILIGAEFGMATSSVLLALIWAVTLGLPVLLTLALALAVFGALASVAPIASFPLFAILFGVISLAGHCLAARIMLALARYGRAQ